VREFSIFNFQFGIERRSRESGQMTPVLVTVFMASVTGSLHCVGMCGPFVAFYSGADASEGARRMLSHAAYSGGRLLAYAVLGLAAGSLGAVLDLAGSLAGFQRSAAVVAGSIMVIWGILALLQSRGARLFSHGSRSQAGRWLGRGFAVISRRPPLVRAVSVGMLSGLLPCGWLWAFLVTAAGTGNAGRGMAVMAAFWAGTVPALVAVGLGAQLVSAPLRRHVPAVTAALLVALGMFAIISRPSSVAATVRKHMHTEQQIPSILEPGECCAKD
jgi:sulfite exporter TauE/SafE